MNESDKIVSVASTHYVPSVRQAKNHQSKARGLRTRTGCLTCRRRRVKCDEDRPRCRQCLKGQRDCVYQSGHGPGDAIANTGAILPESHRSSHRVASQGEQSDSSLSTTTSHSDVLEGGSLSLSISAAGQGTNLPRIVSESGVDDGNIHSDGMFAEMGHVTSIPSPLCSSPGQMRQNGDLTETEQPVASAVSPFFQGSSYSVSFGEAPFDWYQLLAQDALSNIEEYSLLATEANWDFDPTTLLHPLNSKYNPAPNDTNIIVSSNPNTISRVHGVRPSRERHTGDTSSEPWNSTDAIVLEPAEVVLFKHFTKCVGPILDLFDPSNHFSETVPHLALRNIGLMKSMLAVAARHLALDLDYDNTPAMIDHQTSPSFTHSPRAEQHLAVQYYYETLRYLSQAMQYPSYTRSLEILATAIMISTYEMFDDGSSDWERHLRGAFWIQRTQDNDGESSGLQKSVWWAWLRQDIWAAFRHKRRTMTIWRPTKPLTSLGPDELANRSTYLLAKAIEYISDDQKRSQDILKRIEEGELHLKSLDAWYKSLPASFSPISLIHDVDCFYKPIWIHPLRYSASVQVYCFAKLVILINMPSAGGMDEYNERQRILEEVVNMICGLAQAPDEIDAPRAFISIQCLFVAGQCTRAHNRQAALLKILENCMVQCKWLHRSLIDDLKAGWGDS